MIPARLSDADRHRLYSLGHTDQPDRLAPVRGLLVGVLLGGAFWLGLAWPFGSWVAGGAW